MKKFNYNISFQEMARLGMEALAKQKPMSLEQMRAQVLWIKIRGTHTKHKKEEIEHHLKLYFPDKPKEKIELQLNLILLAKSKGEILKILKVF